MMGTLYNRARARVSGARRIGSVAVALALAAVAVAVGTPAHAAAGGDGPLVGVIVRYEPGTGPAAAERAVARLGGTPGRQLGIIDGFAALVPAEAIDRMRTTAGVASVTPDASVRLKSDTWMADK